MKSRQEFKTLEEYKEYLQHYFAGQALIGLMVVKYDIKTASKKSKSVAEELINQLNLEE